MGSFSLSGGVEVFGFISPSNTTDQYPVIDPLYGIDGLRNVNSLSDLNSISPLRRRAGMVVGVSGGTVYYKLNLPPWNNTLSDWSIFNSGGGSSGDYLPLSGGTVTGNTIFTNGLTATTFSASTYLGLPSDVYVSGYSYSNNTFTIERSFGNPNLIATINDVTGLTINGDLNVTGTTFSDIISASTYQNLPLDVFVTGGTFSGGVITFINNSGGTFGVSGISSFDTFVTGFTYGDNTFTIFQNSGNSFSVLVDTFTGLTINGDLNVTGTTYTDTISANTYQNLPIDPDTYITGFSYNNNTFTIGDNLGSTFDATFNDVTGLTINGDLSVTGDTTLNGLTATTISAGTYQNLPLDVFVTGFSYSDNTFTIYQNSGSPLNATIDSVTGLTVNGTLNSTTFSGGTYFGDGSNLTGIIRGSGGGRLFYFNLSNTQSPYYEFSPSATTQTEQSITSGSIVSGVTSTIAGFLTPSNEPYVTILPGGIWSFYLHCYKEDSLASFDIFCEVFKRTSGGTETLLFQTDPVQVTSNAPTPSMVISDGYYSGTTFDLSDRILVKVNGTNTGTSSKTITFITEGQIHYSYATTSLYLSSVDTFTTGFTYSDNKLTIQRNEGLSDLSVTINSVTGLTINGDLSVTGTTSSETISATTYQNLPIDPDTYVTGFSYSNNTFTISQNSGSPLTSLINTMTGLTINGNLSTTGYTVVGGQFVSLGGTSVTSPTYRTSLGGSNLSPRGTFGIESVGASNHRYSFDPVNQNGLVFTVSNNGSVYIARASINVIASGGIGSEIGTMIFNTLNGSDYSERMRINNLGNVGIGTSSPSEKLDVAGKTKTTNIQITSGATNEYVLTSDASGNGTWQQIPSFTGGTVTGGTNFTNGLTANTISATTYQNLPQDIFVSGGTYDNNLGSATFTNTSGGTFNVNGFFTGYTNVVNSLTTGSGLSGDTTIGNITIINTAPDQVVTLSGGTGITTGGTYPNFTITNSLPDQVVTLSGGTNISVSGTYPNFNIEFTGSTTSAFDYGKTYAIANSFQLI